MTSADERTDKRIEILLVEPNPGDTRLVTESFREGKLANDLYVVTDGDEALDFVRQRGEYADEPRPDLLLVETQLPGTSSAELLSELDDDPALSGITVVALTSSDAGEEILRSQGLDADHYARKPIGPDDFVEFVRSIEEFWLAIVKQPPADD